MRYIDRLTIASLLALGIGLCVINVWYAAERSMIPVSLNGIVTKKVTGTEKHPGVDDAYMITIDDKRTMCVDKEPFYKLNVGDRIEKHVWQRELRVARATIPLTWSRDFDGLIWCTLIAIVIMGLMTGAAHRLK